ncbi:MAG: hypothetical protein R2713_10900 [Ilumatobacteraceae bacterium]
MLLECEHDGGRLSQAALSATSNQPGGLAVEVLGLDGGIGFDAAAFAADQACAEFATAMRRIVDEFVDCIGRRESHPLDVHRGLHLQRLIDRAAAQL